MRSRRSRGTSSPAPSFARRSPRRRAVVRIVADDEDGMTTVLFACVHNAGRSQMAAAFFNALADPARARAISAGTQPGERIHPEVVAAMGEVGIDLAGA